MYDQDPLVYHGALKARWGVAMMQAIEHIQQHLSEIVLPLCIMHGSADGIVPASACELVRDNASSEDKTYKVRMYPSGLIILLECTLPSN